MTDDPAAYGYLVSVGSARQGSHDLGDNTHVPHEARVAVTRDDGSFQVVASFTLAWNAGIYELRWLMFPPRERGEITQQLLRTFPLAQLRADAIDQILRSAEIDRATQDIPELSVHQYVAALYRRARLAEVSPLIHIERTMKVPRGRAQRLVEEATSAGLLQDWEVSGNQEAKHDLSTSGSQRA